MSEILEPPSEVKNKPKPYYEYFAHESYKPPDIGTPLAVRIFDITDGPPKEVTEVVTGLAARCVYQGKETLAIQLDEESVGEANIGDHDEKYPARLQAVQPGVHTVLIGDQLHRFLIACDTTCR